MKFTGTGPKSKEVYKNPSFQTTNWAVLCLHKEAILYYLYNPRDFNSIIRHPLVRWSKLTDFDLHYSYTGGTTWNYWPLFMFISAF